MYDQDEAFVKFEVDLRNREHLRNMDYIITSRDESWSERKTKMQKYEGL